MTYLKGRGKRMREFAVVIPAYRPKEDLPQYVNHLIQEQVAQVIVVNDGNGPEFDGLFQQLNQFERCTVLHHKENSGKGAALKTSFRYYLDHFPGLSGLVTADADGQHLVKDVLNVGDRIEKNKEGFVLGTRSFRRKGMPVRSFIGNKTTSRIFQVLFGIYIKDTQTGLRGIATRELDWVIRLKGSQFEYEMNMLINMLKKKKRIVRVDVEAVYEEVHISYYNTYEDSVRIAKQMALEYFSQLKE